MSGARVVWWPGLAVALGAAAATAHGLFEVAEAARVPAAVAWLYPLITDGLALVAYAATARLAGRAARYAWGVVVIAAGLSGLAQAAYLASDAAVEAPAALRFGVGAWPAIAAAVVAHLLYLLAHTNTETAPEANAEERAVSRSTVTPAVQPPAPVNVVQPAGQPEPYNAPSVRPPHETGELTDEPSRPGPDVPARPRVASSPARDRASALAVRHAHRHGVWPTVAALEALASVSHGTAASALRDLRDQPLPLHLINTTTSDDESETQP